MFTTETKPKIIPIPDGSIPNFLIYTTNTDVLASYFTFVCTCLPYKDMLELFNLYVQTNSIDLSIFSSKINLQDKIKVKAKFLNYFLP